MRPTSTAAFALLALVPLDGCAPGRHRNKQEGPRQGGALLVCSMAQWKESPQAQEPVAFGLSIVKPCFSIVSTKSMVAPLR